MFAKRSVRLLLLNQTKYFSVNTVKCENASSQVKNEHYYRNIGENQAIEDNKPIGWNEALPFENIPGPKPLPIIGNFPKFLPYVGKYYGIDPAELHNRLHEEYGEIVALRKIDGKKTVVLLFDPQDMETLFRNEGFWPTRDLLPGAAYYRKIMRKEVFEGAVGVALTQGKEWFDMRTVLNPIFMQPRSAELYVGKMDKVASQFINNMKIMASQNSESEMPADFMNELNKFSLESVCVIALDTHLGCLDGNLKPDSDEQKFINSMSEFFDLVYKIEILPSMWRYFSTPNWKRYVEVQDSIINSIFKFINKAKIESAKDIPDSEASILQRLLKIDEKIAVTTGIDMIQAGVDTTSKTVAATLYYLAKNQKVQQKLRNELCNFLPSPDSSITKEILKQLSYLKAVVKESQRLAPVTVANYRTTVKNIVVRGYQIPKQTEIHTANFTASRQEKYFIHANEFIPERWLRSTVGELSYKNINPFVSLPFGFGPRSCVGKRIANMEVEMMVSKIIRNFELSWPHKDLPFKTNIVHGLEGDLKFNVKEVTE